MDRTGKYLYALSEDANSIDTFEIYTNSGDLTPLPGSPYIINKEACRHMRSESVWL